MSSEREPDRNAGRSPKEGPPDSIEQEQTQMLAQLQRRLLELEAENQQLRTELAARKTARCDGQNVQSTSTCPGVHVHAAEVARVTGELERANEQLRAAFDAMADGLVIQGADGAILKANRAAQRILGLSLEQLAGRKSVDLRWRAIHPDGSPFPGDTHPPMVALRTQQPVPDVLMGVHKPSGELTWINVSSIPIPASQAVLTTFSDHTARKESEEHLHFQSQMLRAVGQSVIATDLDGRITYFNPAAEKLFGWTETEALGRPVVDINVVPTSAEQAKEILDALTRGETWSGEFPLCRRDGSVFMGEVHDAPIFDGHGQMVGLVGVSQDITARKNAEAGLRDSEQTLRSIADGVPIAILRLGIDLRLVFLNRVAKERFGAETDTLLGRSFQELLGEELFRTHQPALEAALAGIPQSFEFSLPRLDDTLEYRWVQYVPHVVDGAVSGILVLDSDITNIRQGARLLTQLSEIVESANDAIIREGLDGRIQSWNRAAERLYGYRAEEIIGQAYAATIPEAGIAQELNARVQVLRGERIEHYLTTRRRKDCTLVEVEVTLSPVLGEDGLFVGVSRIEHDVTQQRLLERQLQHARRLEVIGTLAGGVAHDFNNILQIMMLQLEHLDRHQALPHALRPTVQQLGMAVDRAAKVTAHLLMFARKQTVQFQTIDLNVTVAESATLLRRLLGEQIELRTTLAPMPLGIEADSTTLEQVILNLCINARDAMPQGGVLTLSTALESVSAAESGLPDRGKPGNYAVLSVTDTGSGMTPDVMAHLFEPFFTTKEAGKGTGLGLAAVYGSIQQHNGFVTVASEVGKGSRFRIFLPISDKTPQKSSPEQRKLPENKQARTLLLVEDEELLRSVGSSMLSREGYQVIAAADAPEALRLFGEHGDAIELVISDVVMPKGISGMELAQKLRQIKPHLPIILMSGYSEEILAAESNPHMEVEFLAKPFRYPDLIERIRECLTG